MDCYFYLHSRVLIEKSLHRSPECTWILFFWIFSHSNRCRDNYNDEDSHIQKHSPEKWSARIPLALENPIDSSSDSKFWSTSGTTISGGKKECTLVPMYPCKNNKNKGLL